MNIFKKMTVRELSLAAGLASISAATQLIHIGYQSPTWGMWIDVVAISWIIAFFLFGVRGSLLVSLVGALIITLFAPDTWLGASMKWIATLPTWFTLFFYVYIKKEKIEIYKNWKNLIIPIFAGIILRSALVIPLNYYYAIPIWTGMTPVQAIAAIPWWIIFIFNAIQAIIDVLVAWFIVFRFKIDRYASWYK